MIDNKLEENKTTNPLTNFRSGYVAIIGEPNVGKSTLMNTLIGEKVSIVTKKSQTTRHKIIGILTREDFQIVFLDTPGIMKPKYLLHDVMLKTVRTAIAESDLVLFMIDAKFPNIGKDFEDSSFNILRDQKKPVYLVINKADLVDKVNMLPVIDFYSRKFNFKEIYPISSLKNIGVDSLLDSMVKELPFHPPFYDLDIVSEHHERFFVGEIIREKIFEKFREEIPYSTEVHIVEFREQEGRIDFIQAEIYVERQSQKGILIGKKGEALKEIGSSARQDIEAFLNRPVFLELHVKVIEKWRSRKDTLRQFGYEI